MQVAPFDAWAERTLFYLFKMYLEQSHEGQEYDVAQKCIHVGIPCTGTIKVKVVSISEDGIVKMGKIFPRREKGGI